MRGKAKSLEGVLDRYHIWDARKVSDLFPESEFIDVTITSPPYWDLKDYGADPQIGFGQEYEEYLEDLEQVFREIYARTKVGGTLWVISDTIKRRGKLILLPFDLAQRLERVGWILQDIIIWNKDRTLPWSHRGKLRNIFEYVTFYSKGRKFNYHLDRIREIDDLREWWVRYPERYSPRGKAPVRTWHIPIPRQGSWGNNWVRHFNPLPPQLIERILLLTTNKGDVVLDPFCGSGTVLAQAHVMGRRYVGLDINSNYKRMFETQVLPAIRALHKHRQEELEKIEMQKRNFEQLILSLRKVKYPKELVRLYRKRYGDLDPRSVLALGAASREGVVIIFLFDSESEIPLDFLVRLREVSQNPPLSKYGINPTMEVCLVGSLSQKYLEQKGVHLESSLYVYLRGRTYAWERELSVRRWIEEVRAMSPRSRSGKYPPIVSDINVRVDPKSPFHQLRWADE